jgi:predicted nucleic acid-binding Zn ribbon protein
MTNHKWEELGFDPIKDGYWATPERIKQRILEKERQRRKSNTIIFSVIMACAIVMLLTLWIML